MIIIGYMEGKVGCKDSGTNDSCKTPTGAIIGILERTLLYLIIISTWMLFGYESLKNIGLIILGILGIKSLYRFESFGCLKYLLQLV